MNYNIFIRDNGNSFSGIISDDENSENTTITAKKGYINKKFLILNDGSIQTKDSKGDIKTVNFKKTELSLGTLISRTTKKPKLQETYTSTLLDCFLKNPNKIKLRKEFCPKDPAKISEVIEHLSRRIGMPIYIPLVSLICSFLLIANREKKYGFLKKYLFFIFGFIVLILAEILVRYSGFSKTNTLIYFTLPIFSMPLIYLILFKKLAYERISK